MIESIEKKKKTKSAFNLEASSHVCGRSQFLDDFREWEGTAFAKLVPSTVAHGELVGIDVRQAEKSSGVIRIITSKDIPGENQIGGIIPDEVLLVDREIHFKGQIIAIIVAETEDQAMIARSKVKLNVVEKPAVTDPRVAFYQSDFLSNPRKFELGDVEKGFENAVTIVEGTAETGGQEHVYLEPQGAYAIPSEQGGVKIISSTQGPTVVQRVVARVLGLGMHQIEVDVLRLGGGFGGKEDQASCWAAIASLSAFITQRPVKCILNRKEDMQMTGKRNPYVSEYKLGLDDDLKIVAFEARYFQNGGAAADLSPAILGRTLFHATNSYFVPNARLTAYSCKTNLPPNTAFRGFGGPQGMFVIESAIHHAARHLNIDPFRIQKANLIRQGNVFPYGQLVETEEASACWDQVMEKYEVDHLVREIRNFNSQNHLWKKGFALQPVCFGISFTNTQMNQSRALVHVYSDGSVGMSTGAVEMGQGVHTKLVQIAAREFGLSLDNIKLETTNTTRVANTSPSAASSTTDLNGKALIDASDQIKRRLFQLAAELLPDYSPADFQLQDGWLWASGKKTMLNWRDLIAEAFAARINLSAKGHYATPIIHFDKKREKGHPFSYHVCGTAFLSCIVDCVRGEYRFEKALIVHDCGKSMNLAIDMGQMEGGLIQGLGWMTTEEVIYDPDGNLKSNMLANYKIPDIYSVPEEMQIHFLEADGTDLAVYKSKAVGEPPLMYGLGAFFALYNAVLSFNPEAILPYQAPMTPEKVLLGLYSRKQ